MHPLIQAENAHYRTLAGYETEALPVFLMLKNRDWQLVRGLILKQWQRIETQTQREFFDRQNGPEYLRSRYEQRRGAYPSRQIYLPHEFCPLRMRCPSNPDQTGRVPVGTMAPRQKPELRLAAEEKEGYDFLVSRQNANTDAREQVAGELLRVAQILSRNPALKILLEAGAPRLGQLSGAGNALGYAAYFLDCWQRFHEYEQAPPAATALAFAGAAPAGPTVADRWDGLLLNYTLPNLNKLLVFAGLLETAEPLAVANGTKPGQWVAVAAALYKRNKTRADKAALHRAFAATYGPAVGSLSSFSREYNKTNEAAQRCYSRALSRLE